LRSGARVKGLCNRFRFRWREICVFWLAALIWVILARPVSLHLSSRLWGGGGDALGDAVFFQSISNSPELFPRTIEVLGAPDGYLIPWARLIAQAPLTIYMLVTSRLVNGIFAMNVLGALGFCLTASVLYAIGRRVTGDNLVSLAAPIVVTFQAGQLWNGVGAQGFVHLWIIGAVIYAFARARCHLSNRNDVVAGLVWMFCMLWNPYLLLIGLVVGGSLFLSVLIFRVRKQKHMSVLRRLCLPMLIGPSMAGVIILGGIVRFGTLGVRPHPSIEADLFSARPMEYLLPPVGNFLVSVLKFLDPRPDVGTNLYVGLIAFGVAMYALRDLRSESESSVLIQYSVTAIIVSFVLSGPRFVNLFGQSIELPTGTIMRFTTAWRIFGRFGLVVLVGIGLLATLGLARIRRRFGTGLVLVLLTLMMVDLKSASPHGYYKLQSSSALECLKHLEKGVAIEFPTSDQNYEQWDRQSIHGHPIANGAEPGSDWDRVLWELEPSKIETYRRLQDLGIKYAIFDVQALKELDLDWIAKRAKLELTGCADFRFVVFAVAGSSDSVHKQGR